MTNPERNRAALYRIMNDGFNRGQLDVLDECIALDARHRHEFDEGTPDFRTHAKQLVTMLRGAMPDFHLAIEETVAEGDRVAARIICTGTHTGGPLFGVPAAGKPVRLEQFYLLTFNDDGQLRR